MRYPWPQTIDPDCQITVEVLQFDRGPGSQVVLAAGWSLLDHDAKGTGSTHLINGATLSGSDGLQGSRPCPEDFELEGGG